MSVRVAAGIEGETREERNTEFHKRIVSARRIPHTASGNQVRLECGHEVGVFGKLALADRVILCVRCRIAATGE